MTEDNLDIIEQTLNNLFLTGHLDEKAALILLSPDSVYTFWHPDGVDPEESEDFRIRGAINLLMEAGFIVRREE